jgi:hypothetical protein
MVIVSPTGVHKDLLNQIKDVFSSQNKNLLWVPIATFLLGGLAALVQYLLSRSPKYSVREVCTICYSQNRSVMTEPCKHLVMCGHCAWMVRTCPFCRVDIA